MILKNHNYFEIRKKWKWDVFYKTEGVINSDLRFETKGLMVDHDNGCSNDD